MANWMSHTGIGSRCVIVSSSLSCVRGCYVVNRVVRLIELDTGPLQVVQVSFHTCGAMAEQQIIMENIKIPMLCAAVAWIGPWNGHKTDPNKTDRKLRLRLTNKWKICFTSLQLCLITIPPLTGWDLFLRACLSERVEWSMQHRRHQHHATPPPRRPMEIRHFPGSRSAFGILSRSFSRIADTDQPLMNEWMKICV